MWFVIICGDLGASYSRDVKCLHFINIRQSLCHTGLLCSSLIVITIISWHFTNISTVQYSHTNQLRNNNVENQIKYLSKSEISRDIPERVTPFLHYLYFTEIWNDCIISAPVPSKMFSMNNKYSGQFSTDTKLYTDNIF